MWVVFTMPIPTVLIKQPRDLYRSRCLNRITLIQNTYLTEGSSINSSSLPLVAGDAALLENPTEIFDLYEAMEALIKSPSLREKLMGKGLEQSKKITWEKTTPKTLEIYRRVLAN